MNRGAGVRPFILSAGNGHYNQFQPSPPLANPCHPRRCGRLSGENFQECRAIHPTQQCRLMQVGH